jgi:hypothetical protein
MSTYKSERFFTITICLAFVAFLAFWFSLLFVQSPNVAGVENSTIYFVQRILNGTDLYTNPAVQPYSIAQYGPLYYFLVAGIAKVIGIGPDQVLELFLLNRIISLLLLLSISFTIFYIARKIFNSSLRKSRFIFAAVFIFFEVSSFARADSLSNAAFFLALYFFLLAEGSIARKRLYLLIISGVIATVAVFAKQSAITLPLFCSVFFIVFKNYKSLLLYIASCLFTAFILLFIFLKPASISIIYMNTVMGINNGINMTVYLDYIVQEFLATQGLLWIIAMALVVYILSKEKKRPYKIISFLILGQFLFSVVGAMKYGSSSNYFTEWWVLVILGAGLCWQHFVRITSSIDTRLLYFLLIVVVLTRVTTIIQPVYNIFSLTANKNREQKLETEQKVAGFMQEHSGQKEFLVFNNIFSPDSYLNNLLFREAVMPQTDIIVLATYYRKVFDYSRFSEQINKGAIQYIVLDKSGPVGGFLKMDYRNYHPLTVIDNYQILEYKSY